MSLRVTACFLYVLGFSVYAWRNWFVSLCAAILLMAVLEHPDMPRSIAGIQGLNPWNILFANVLLAWATQRRKQGLVWDLPRSAAWLFAAYMAVIFWTSLRLFWTRTGYEDLYTTTYIISEHFINCLKWTLPGLLLYDGCRTRKHVQVAVVVVLLLYLLLALQVIKHVPLRVAISGDRFSRIASKNIQRNVGYNRVTLSNMLAGASWALLGAHVLFRKRLYQLAVLGLAGVVALGQALTGGRAGYGSWAVVGVILCLVRWRWMLPIMAGTALGILTLLPSVRERLFYGIGGQEGAIVEAHDDYKITSGRTLAWPLVVEKIRQDPIFGFGREAMVTTGIRDYMRDIYGEADAFPHPHNAYLQVLLDSGIVGFIPVMAFYLMVLMRGFPLLLDRREPLCAAVGGMACALVLTLLVGSMGGQTFYPREGSVGMWCAIFLAFRLWVERQRSRETGQPLFGERPESAQVEEEPVAAEARS